MSKPTKEEFVNRNFHLIFGMMVDCLTWTDRGEGASRKIGQMREILATQLRLMYDQCLPPNDPVANGQIDLAKLTNRIQQPAQPQPQNGRPTGAKS